MPNENIREDWIGYPEAERFTGFSRRTLRRLVRNGQPRAARMGQVTRIDKHSLEAFVEHHATQPKLPGFGEADR